MRLSSWPKEVPGSWFSEFKRGKIVSALSHPSFIYSFMKNILSFETKRTWVFCLIFFLYSTTGQTPVRARLLKDAVTAAPDPSTSRANPQTLVQQTQLSTYTHTAFIFDAVESYEGLAAPLWNETALCFCCLFRLFSILSEALVFLLFIVPTLPVLNPFIGACEKWLALSLTHTLSFNTYTNQVLE